VTDTTNTYTTPDGTILPDDGCRYALTGPRGVDEFLDNLAPHAEHHTITVYGSTDLARRLAEADELGVCVAFRRLDESGPATHDASPAMVADEDSDGF
jgi:hypothetical protein